MDGDVTYAELRFPPSVGSRRTLQAEPPPGSVKQDEEVTYSNLHYPLSTGHLRTSRTEPTPDAQKETHPEKAAATRSSLWMFSAVLLGILCLLLVILSIALGLLLLAKKETTNEYDVQKEEYAERLRQVSDQCQELNKTMNETKVKLNQATAALNQTTADLNQTKADLKSFEEKIQHLETYTGRHWYCPEGWTSVYGTCYYVSTSRNDWLSSLEDCIARDAHLAIFSDTTNLKSLRSLWENFWVGSMYNNEKFVWYNSSDFLSLTTVNEYYGPYYRVCAEGARCGAASIRRAALDFAFCTSRYPWICEKPAVQLHVDEALLPPSVFVNSVKYVSIP